MSIIMEEKDTKSKLLDACEHLFAEHGISGTSLRKITSEAGTNLASVHYHFGSKEELVIEMYRRRLEPICLERERLLDEVVLTEDLDINLEQVITAFIKPMISIHIGKGEQQRLFLKLFDVMHSENVSLRDKIIANFEQTNIKFFKILKEILPELPDIDLIWRFKFIIGVVLSSARFDPNSEPFNLLKIENMDLDFHMDRILPFLVSGFQSNGQFGLKENKAESI